MATGGTPVLLEKTLLARTLPAPTLRPGTGRTTSPASAHRTASRSAPHPLKERTAPAQGAPHRLKERRTASRSAGVPPVFRHDIRRGAPTDGNRRDAGAP